MSSILKVPAALGDSIMGILHEVLGFPVDIILAVVPANVASIDGLTIVTSLSPKNMNGLLAFHVDQVRAGLTTEVVVTDGVAPVTGMTH
jgi:hypothetical protein